MNSRFKPLYAHVFSKREVMELIAREEAQNGNLIDLAFCAEYPIEKRAGVGTLSVYRFSEATGWPLVNTARDNMAQRLWFIENPGWVMLRFTATASELVSAKVDRFEAAVAYSPQYRPEIRVNLDKPVAVFQFLDLPRLCQYPQQGGSFYQSLVAQTKQQALLKSKIA